MASGEVLDRYPTVASLDGRFSERIGEPFGSTQKDVVLALRRVWTRSCRRSIRVNRFGFPCRVASRRLIALA